MSAAAVASCLALWSLLGADANAPAALRLRFTPGRSLTYRVHVEKEILQANGAEEFQSTVDYSAELTTVAVSDDGAVLRYRMDWLVWKSAGAQGAGAFDSRRPPRPDEPEAMTTLRQSLLQSYDVTLDPRGQVVKARLSSDDVDDALTERNLQSSEFVGEEQIRNLLRLLHGWLPEIDGPVDQPWRRREELSLGVLALARESVVSIQKMDGPRVTVGARIQVSDIPTDGVVNDDARTIGRVLPEKPGISTIVFHRQAGVVESVDAEIAFGLRVDEIAVGKRKGGATTQQRVRARHRIALTGFKDSPR